MKVTVSYLLAAAMIVTACSYRSGATYTPDEAGSVMQVRTGKVTSSRQVVIEGLNSQQAAGWGTVIGATVAGAAAYGLTQADTPLGVAVTIIAAVGGALAGTVVEEQKNRRPGAEYVIQPTSGESLAVVQSLTGDEKVLPPGTPVVVLYGKSGYVRVVPEG